MSESVGLRHGPVVFAIAVFSVFFLGIGLLLFIERPHNNVYTLYLAKDLLNDSTILTSRDEELVRDVYNNSTTDERKILAVMIHNDARRPIEMFSYIDVPGHIWSFATPWQVVASPSGFHVLGEPCVSYVSLTDGEDFTAMGDDICDRYKATRADRTIQHARRM